MKLFTKKIEKFTLYVGLNDKNTRKQELTKEQAKRKISRILANNNIEGATFLDAQGIYTYITDKSTETENTFKIELLFVNKKQVKKAIEQIKTELNQETIAIVTEKIASALI